MYGPGKDKSYQPAADRLHFLQIPCQPQHSVSISYRAAAPCGAVFFVHHSDPRLPDSAASPFSVFSGLASGQTVSGTERNRFFAHVVSSHLICFIIYII